jgi:hypothetical protein
MVNPNLAGSELPRTGEEEGGEWRLVFRSLSVGRDFFGQRMISDGVCRWCHIYGQGWVRFAHLFQLFQYDGAPSSRDDGPQFQLEAH